MYPKSEWTRLLTHRIFSGQPITKGCDRYILSTDTARELEKQQLAAEIAQMYLDKSEIEMEDYREVYVTLRDQ